MSDGAREGPPRLDEPNECIWRGDRRVDLPPKSFLVLRCLAGRPNQIVSKADLFTAAWPATHVTDAALAVVIRELRDALGDDARQPRFIETVHRRGYRWIGRLETGTWSAAAASAAVALQSELVGRRRPLAELEQAFARARDGERQVVFVSGEPGIGKTALVDAFCTALAAGPAAPRVVRGQCVDAYGPGEAYMPVLEALESLCGGADGARVVEVLRRFAPSWLVQLAGVLEVDEAASLARALAESSSERMIGALLRALDEIAAETPLVLVMEDLHWSDHATVALLSALARRRAAARLLLLATLRPADAVARLHPVAALERELVAAGICTRIALTGLDETAVGAYLEQRFPAQRFPAELAAILQGQTGGNALFLVNAVDDLVARGQLAEVDGVWQCAAGTKLLSASVPESTRQLVEARLDELPAESRALLEAAGAIGATFCSQALTAALARDQAEVETECLRLARVGRFLEDQAREHWPDGTTGLRMAFQHAVYLQVLRDRIGPERRRTLHRRIGERLESGYRDSTAEVAVPLSLHFELGDDIARAIRYRRQASAVAERRFAHREAVEHLRHALDLLAAMPATPERDLVEIALQAGLLPLAYALAGDVPFAIDPVVERIRELAGRCEPTVEALQAIGALMSWHSVRDELRELHAVCELGIRRASLSPSVAIFEVASRGVLGLCEFLRGDPLRGAENLAACAELPPLVPALPVDPGIMAASDGGVCRCVLGSPLSGLAMVREAQRRAREAAHDRTLGYVTGGLLRAAVMIGDEAAVAEVAGGSAEVAGQFQLDRWQAVSRIAAGWLAAVGGAADGVDAIRSGRRTLEHLGIHVYQPFYGAMEAAALLRLGRFGEAEEAIAAALALVETSDERWCEAELHRLRGESRLTAARKSRRRGAAAVAAAVDCFRRAVDLARAGGARWWELRAQVSLVRALGGTDDGRARENLAALLAGFAEGHQLADLRSAAEVAGRTPQPR